MRSVVPATDAKRCHVAAAGVGPRFTLDIDTGGTFTDCYVTNGAEVILTKADTTPHDLSQGVLACIDQAAVALGLTRQAFLRNCEVARLSTTVGTNTFINRNGARVGLLLGTRLAVELDRLSPRLPLQRDLVALIPEDVDATHAANVRAATHHLLERGARILVIALEGDGDLPRRERAVRDIIAEDYPRHYLGAVPVLPSHQVTPINDGAIRIQTAVLDAYIHPVMSRFLYRVEDQLRADGLARPLQVGNANGGTSRVAKTTAMRTWGSGPAGGVAGAAKMATHLGMAHAVAVDIGGTSADICFINGGRWDYEVSPSIEGVTVALPTLRLHSAGIGCGSIVRLNGNDIVVGPDSAGAQPGPAAFGLGGELPTVTDAACCLGYFDPANFLGGRRKLDMHAARRVLTEKVAAPLSIANEAAAVLVIEHAAEKIAGEIQQRLDGTGTAGDLQRSLLATGGGGGLLGHAVARLCGFMDVYVFPVSPVFSAFGLSRLDVSHSYERMPAINDIESSLEAIREVALADMRGEGFDLAVSLQVEGEFRLGNEIAVEPLGFDFAGVAKIVRERYGSLRLLRLIATAPGRHAALARPSAGPRGEPVATREVWWHSGVADTPVFDWQGVRGGTAIRGPAILETSETTLLIPPGVVGEIGSLGEVRMQINIIGVPSRQFAHARAENTIEAT